MHETKSLHSIYVQVHSKTEHDPTTISLHDFAHENDNQYTQFYKYTPAHF